MPGALFNSAVSFVVETFTSHKHCTVGAGGRLSLSSLSTEEVEASELEPRLVYCYPVRLAVSAPPMPSVEMHMENSVVCIRYKGEMVKVSRSYFSKLVRAGEALVDGMSGGLGSSLTRILISWPVSEKVMKSLLHFLLSVCSGSSTAIAVWMTLPLRGSCLEFGVFSAAIRYRPGATEGSLGREQGY